MLIANNLAFSLAILPKVSFLAILFFVLKYANKTVFYTFL